MSAVRSIQLGKLPITNLTVVSREVEFYATTHSVFGGKAIQGKLNPTVAGLRVLLSGNTQAVQISSVETVTLSNGLEYVRGPTQVFSLFNGRAVRTGTVSVIEKDAEKIEAPMMRMAALDFIRRLREKGATHVAFGFGVLWEYRPKIDLVIRGRRIPVGELLRKLDDVVKSTSQ